jgi:uncharacterized membrane protein YeaQ/YmgE (transglycosylase-associated protein family)
MHIIWTIIIGFIAGVIAKFVTPGKNEPSGFILTTILGIVGAFVATYLGQAIGWYRADEGAGLIGAVVGAVIILLIWGLIAGRRRSLAKPISAVGNFVLIFLARSRLKWDPQRLLRGGPSGFCANL